MKREQKRVQKKLRPRHKHWDWRQANYLIHCAMLKWGPA